MQDALNVLRPTPWGEPLDAMDEADVAMETRLREVLGDNFGQTVGSDVGWAREILGIASNAS